MPPRRSVSVEPENTNNGQLLQQLTQVIANAIQQSENGNGMAKRIAARHPPHYLGEEDPRILENWIRTFDKIFLNENCPENQRVDIASFYLQEEADIWWVAEGPRLLEQPNFGWDQFKDELRDRFYSQTVKMQLCEEFLHFKQKDLSIQEYHKRFLELARFAPRIVPTEADRIEKFISGMNYETQKAMVMANCQTLNEAYTLASKHYHIYMKQKEIINKKRKVDEIQARQKPRDKKFQVRGFGGENQKNQNQQQIGARPYTCKKCGQNHPGRDCSGKLVNCFKCGNRGHRAYECKLKQNQQGSGFGQQSHNAKGQNNVNREQLTPPRPNQGRIFESRPS